MRDSNIESEGQGAGVLVTLLLAGLFFAGMWVWSEEKVDRMLAVYPSTPRTINHHPIRYTRHLEVQNWKLRTKLQEKEEEPTDHRPHTDDDRHTLDGLIEEAMQ